MLLLLVGTALFWTLLGTRRLSRGGWTQRLCVRVSTPWCRPHLWTVSSLSSLINCVPPAYMKMCIHYPYGKYGQFHYQLHVYYSCPKTIKDYPLIFTINYWYRSIVSYMFITNILLLNTYLRSTKLTLVFNNTAGDVLWQVTCCEVAFCEVTYCEV